jgi:hypothetical protein
MCLALYKPAKATLSKSEMATAFKANPDGAGFAYYDPTLRRVEIQRGYFTFDSLWQDIEPIIADKCPLILHFRWATHGDVNVENCHPFALKDGALIHNGIISGMGTSVYKSSNKYYQTTTCATNECDDDRSDTREFVEDYLDGMTVNVLRGAKKLIEHTIGYSKLVTIHNDGSVIIFNEDSGHWRGGVWYSNNSYEPSKAKYANPTNLVPAKYDYYSKSTKTDSKYPTKSTDFLYQDDDYSDLTVCPKCWTDCGHEVMHNHAEDSFLLSCIKCDEVWEIDGNTLTNKEYDEMLESATKLTFNGV